MTATRGVPTDADAVLLDVNVLAIGLVDDHPGHQYVKPELDAGLAGEFDPLVFDYHPLRAQYVMTAEFGIDRVAARNSVQSLLRQPIRIVGASRETIIEAYGISAERNHDVYDCFLIALGHEHDADCVLTTDTDFARLCEGEPFAYANPVPEPVLERFGSHGG